MVTIKTILIIEDDLLHSNAIAAIVSLGKFAYLQSRDGEEALSIAFSKHPDLILLDLLMPGMSGMDILKNLREDSWGKKVPIIILTNLGATDGQLIKAVQMYEPAFHLIKSDWKLCDIVKKIEEVLGI